MPGPVTEMHRGETAARPGDPAGIWETGNFPGVPGRLFFLSQYLPDDLGNVLADNVEFQVHHRSRLYLVEVGDLPGKGNYCHLERFVA